jgi:hypothetical protein
LGIAHLHCNERSEVQVSPKTTARNDKVKVDSVIASRHSVVIASLVHFEAKQSPKKLCSHN